MPLYKVKEFSRFCCENSTVSKYFKIMGCVPMRLMCLSSFWSHDAVTVLITYIVYILYSLGYLYVTFYYISKFFANFRLWTSFRKKIFHIIIILDLGDLFPTWRRFGKKEKKCIDFRNCTTSLRYTSTYVELIYSILLT